MRPKTQADYDVLAEQGVWYWRHTRADGRDVTYSTRPNELAPHWCETHSRASSESACVLCAEPRRAHQLELELELWS